MWNVTDFDLFQYAIYWPSALDVWKRAQIH